MCQLTVHVYTAKWSLHLTPFSSGIASGPWDVLHVHSHHDEQGGRGLHEQTVQHHMYPLLPAAVTVWR